MDAVARTVQGGQSMSEYTVSYMVVYTETVEADSPEEAAEIVQYNCPYDVSGAAAVINEEIGEYWDIE